MDPFTPIWRTYGSSGARRTGVYHLDENCPIIHVTQKAGKGSKVVKGRLGAMLAAKRRLCSYEAARLEAFA